MLTFDRNARGQATTCLRDIKAQYLENLPVLHSVVFYGSLKSLTKTQCLWIRRRHGADVVKILKHISNRHPHCMAACDHCLSGKSQVSQEFSPILS